MHQPASDVQREGASKGKSNLNNDKLLNATEILAERQKLDHLERMSK